MKKVLLLLLLSISLVVSASCQNNSSGNDIIPEDNASSGNNSSTSGDNSNNNSPGSTDNSNNATITPLEQAFVVDAIKKIPNIISVAAATEYNDPNGQLNKQGGYIADIFFSVDVINQNSIAGITLVEKGTDAGGSIEIYNNVEDAKKRNEYLVSFDGTILSSGSHKVIGTCVVRTSSKLTASLQNILSNNIEKALAGNAEAFVNMNTYLIEIAKQIAKEEKLSELGISAKLFELGYPLEKSKAIAATCGVNFDEIAKGLAEGYANYYATVYPKLIADLLSSQTFTEANIKYAIENANINWQTYAKIHANDYANINRYISPLDIVVYLNNDRGYTVEDSEYGAWNCEVDWNEKAIEYIEYIENDGLLGPKKDYITSLIDVGFTKTQSEYAVKYCEKDWNNHALLCLESYYNGNTFPPKNEECTNMLKEWGFSETEITYALTNYSGLIYPDDGTSGLTYTLQSDGTYFVTNCNSLDKVIFIPSMYNGKVVSGIGKNAFASGLVNYYMTDIYIPNTVKIIEETAFNGCDKLSQVIFENNSQLLELQKGAFANCTNLVQISWGDTSSLVKIGANVFQDCTSMQQISIPVTVTTIGSSAFYNCSNLTTITIPENVTSIGYKAFQYCNRLTSVIFENPNGWVAESRYSGIADKSISNLSNAQTAANHLLTTYRDDDWKRG